MRDFSQDHRWLSINTATVRKQHGAEWPLLQILDACAERGIRAVAPWRDQVAAAGLQATAQRLRDHGLQLSGYCRG
ncbi:MAG TPA: sugar phosphate isomerase/epimerase, partial [Rubrivivax sp.]|nr:sugar phosphate isomerase/epimerase [Rubrivivax sp.]